MNKYKEQHSIEETSVTSHDAHDACDAHIGPGDIFRCRIKCDECEEFTTGCINDPPDNEPWLECPVCMSCYDARMRRYEEEDDECPDDFPSLYLYDDEKPKYQPLEYPWDDDGFNFLQNIFSGIDN
jgi:hypothetical protein